MTDHAPLPVSGYTPQDENTVAIVNVNKQLEEIILRRLDDLPTQFPGVDMRWVAIARTDIQTGFMAMNRAIFKPKRITIPGELSND